MQTQRKIHESELSPSFSCYSSDSLTSKAVDKVIREEHARLHEFWGVVEGDEFEFSLVFRDEEVWASFPVFNRDILLNDEINNISKDGSAFITSSLGNLFIDNDQEESSPSSSSSSEVDELENIPSDTFCVWKPKITDRASSGMSKCKKSNSTGSTGSRKWKIRYSFKRCNSEGNKEPMVSLLTPSPNDNKKTDSSTSPKQKRISGKLKTQTPVHELFYVQRRAENEMGKKKSYLPYRKDLVGLFANINGMGKMLPFLSSFK